jgi:uncharacterized Tic20 family protein
MNKQAATFTQVSYVLSIVTAVVIVAAIAVGMFGGESGRIFQNICWLGTFTSGIGTFLAWAARQDFAVNPPSETLDARSRSAFRYNLIFVLIMVMGTLVIVALNLLGLGTASGTSPDLLTPTPEI